MTKSSPYHEWARMTPDDAAAELPRVDTADDADEVVYGTRIAKGCGRIIMHRQMRRCDPSAAIKRKKRPMRDGRRAKCLGKQGKLYWLTRIIFPSDVRMVSGSGS